MFNMNNSVHPIGYADDVSVIHGDGNRKLLDNKTVETKKMNESIYFTLNL